MNISVPAPVRYVDFGRECIDLDREMHRIVQQYLINKTREVRKINRDKVRELVREARRLNEILLRRGVHSCLCVEYEDAAKAAYMDAVEAFHSRNEV